MKSQAFAKLAGFIALVAASSGCTGIPYKMATVEPDLSKYEVLGPATGYARGFMVFNIIPVNQNNKIERAVEGAIQSKGGDEMIDISVKESWFWAYVLNAYAVDVTGTVIKKK